MKTIRFLALAVAVFVSMAAANANMLEFAALLDGLQETPPVATPATGDATLMVDDTTLDWTLTGNYSGLIGTVSAAHIHGPAPPGTPAGVIAGGTLMAVGSPNGTLSGAGTLTAAQFTDLMGGLFYVNVHSSFRPGGEIRGQLGYVPEPGTIVLLGMGGVGVFAAAWRRRLQVSRR
jgi:hypothetical protein